MASKDFKDLFHHLNEMYKAVGVLSNSLMDITNFVDADIHARLATNISELDAIIAEIAGDAHAAYLKLKRK